MFTKPQEKRKKKLKQGFIHTLLNSKWEVYLHEDHLLVDELLKKLFDNIVEAGLVVIKNVSMHDDKKTSMCYFVEALKIMKKYLDVLLCGHPWNSHKLYMII